MLLELVDRILDKGIVVDAWARISLLGIEILTVEARVVVASVETYLRYAEAIGNTALASMPRPQQTGTQQIGGQQQQQQPQLGTQQVSALPQPQQNNMAPQRQAQPAQGQPMQGQPMQQPPMQGQPMQQPQQQPPVQQPQQHG